MSEHGRPEYLTNSGDLALEMLIKAVEGGNAKTESEIKEICSIFQRILANIDLAVVPCLNDLLASYVEFEEIYHHHRIERHIGDQ